MYLWFDDATTNRLGDYDTGLIDNWLNLSSLYQGTQWDSGDYYKYDTGNSALNSLRRNVAERDVYIEAEFRHELCEQDNMSTGLVVRGIIDSGTGGTERADHYYTGMRGHNASCGEAYSWDANIQKTQSGTRAVNGVRPGTIATGQWRSQALAAWGVNPTNLRYWDANASWSDRGFAGPDDVLTQGTDGGANDYEGAGFAGVWFVQDKADLRNIIIRRYVDPEPTLAPGPAETQVP